MAWGARGFRGARAREAWGKLHLGLSRDGLRVHEPGAEERPVPIAS